MPTVAPVTQLRTDAGQSLRLVNQIASSGEGVVWETDRAGFVAKVYHQPTPDRIAKLRVMIANPPHDPMLRQNHISFAWPTELLCDLQGNYVGFLMPAIRDSVKLSSIYNPRLRNRKAPRFNWYYLHATALNVASVIESIHAKGYVVGDIKPQNLLVNNRALVSVIDTDSFQIVDPQTNQLYRCLVGSEGFTPPELMGRELGKVDQSEVHDRYRLGVLIYLLLFGDHPFKGKWVGMGEAPSPVELARRGYWPFGPGSLIQPGPSTVPLDVVHGDLQKSFHRCFTDGHTQTQQRPTAAEWSQALRASIANLKVCSVQTNHYFSRNQLHCYWCERKQRLGLDIFDTKQLQQIAKAKPKTNTPVSTTRIWKMPSIAMVAPQRRQPWAQRYRRELAAGGAFVMAFICLIFLIAPDWGSIYPQLRQMFKSLDFKGEEPENLPPRARLPLPQELAADPALSPLEVSSGLPSADPSAAPSVANSPGSPNPSASLQFDNSVVIEATVLALSATGDRLAMSRTDSAAGIIQVWETKSGKLLHQVRTERTPVFALTMSDDGQRLMATSADGTVQMWDLSAGNLAEVPQVVEPIATQSQVDAPHAIAVSADGQWLATRRLDQRLLVRNLQTQQTKTLGNRLEGDPILTLTPNGQYLASTDLSGDIWLWDVERGQLVSRSHRDLIGEDLTRAVALSTNAQLLARGSWSGDIIVWDLVGNRRWKTLSGETTQMVSSLVISRNNQYLISGGSDREIRLWDLKTGRFLRKLSAHQAPIRTLALSANGKVLVSSSEDQTVRFWSIPEGRLLLTLR
jgi:serine/threonine protein kinase